MAQAPTSGSDDIELKKVLDQFHKDTAAPKFIQPLVRLHSLVGEILKRVQTKDGRFAGQVVNVGSDASGMAALASSEFDILLHLNIDGTFEEYKLPGLAKYRLSGSSATLWKDASAAGYLQPAKVIDIFQKHVREVATLLGAEMGEDLTVGGEVGPAVTIASAFQTSILYKADLVVAVKCRGWPASANAAWLQSGYSQEWPKRATIDAIKHNGFELVGRNPYNNRDRVFKDDDDFLWTISMSRAETLLLQNIDAGSLCHKKCLIIMKALLLHSTCFVIPSTPLSLEQPSGVQSYHLKTMLFLESETYPSAQEWADGKLPKRFRSFVFNFHRRMTQRNLPNFFFPEVNLYHGYQGADQLFLKLIVDPTGYIRSIRFDEQLNSVGHNEKFLYAIK